MPTINPRRKRKKTIILSDKKLRVEICKNQAEIILGLSGRRSLRTNAGMLFIYKQIHIISIWMKNMNFPLDVIWIRRGKVVGWMENIPPEGRSPRLIYLSPKRADQMLEVKAGWIKKNGLKLGDKLIDVDESRLKKSEKQK